MRGAITFNKTVIGYKHIQKNIPCEDFSASFSDAYGLCDIAIVADGHGDPSCFRSQSGSMMAVNSAMRCLKEFASCWVNDLGTFRDNISSLKERDGMIKRLTDAIISNWYEKIQSDISENPISEEEYLMAGDMANLYRTGERVEHIYGTTLMAALRLVDILILIHQGDGRCDVFYADGSVDQPIPWDDRCHENVTTSMCDKDVASSIRSCVIDLSQKNIAACYLGSDGVEDSYRNMEGTHLFYQQLSCDLLERNFEGFDQFLGEKLTALSKEGSADDVSVAGIVYPNSIKNLYSLFKEKIKSYNLFEEKQVLEEKLFSMERKHSVLQKRYIEAQKVIAAGEEELSKLEEKSKLISKEIEDIQKEINAVSMPIQKEENNQEENGLIQLVRIVFHEPEEILRERLNKKLNAKIVELEDCKQSIEELRQRQEADKLKSEKEISDFKSYDITYQQIAAQIKELNDRIDNMSNRQLEEKQYE